MEDDWKITSKYENMNIFSSLDWIWNKKTLSSLAFSQAQANCLSLGEINSSQLVYTGFSMRQITRGQLFSLKFFTLTDFSDRERVLKLEIARNLVNIDDRKGPIQRKIQVWNF